MRYIAISQHELARLGITPLTARLWAVEGFGPSDAALWSEVYADPRTARERRAAGYADPFDSMRDESVRRNDESWHVEAVAPSRIRRAWRRVLTALIAVVAALWSSADFVGRLQIVSETVNAMHGPNRDARLVDWITGTPVWIPAAVLLIALIVLFIGEASARSASKSGL